MTRSLLLALSMLMGAPVLAQSYPVQPVKLIVPYTPGGPADIVARFIADRLGQRLGQSVVIENRGGASGMIGTEMVAKAPADGYTLLFGTNQTHGVNPSLFAKMPYNATKDFVAVASTTAIPFFLTTSPALPVSSVKELIALAKKEPGKLNYSSAGNGTGTHLAGELLKSSAGIDMTHVPYKGGGDAITDVVAGRVQVTFTGVPAGLPFIKAGKLRALAVTGSQRLKEMPDIPTVAETLPGFEVVGWNGIFAPAGTPATVVARINTEVNAILETPEARERLAALGAVPMPGTSAQFDRYVRDEIAKWAAVVQAAAIKPD